MTIKALIKRLQQVPDQDRVVLLSSDPEGNHFSLLSDNGISDQYAYTGKGYNISLTDEADEGTAALVLWP